MGFNPLDHPVSLSYPSRIDQSPWIERSPLVMLLVDLLRPAMFVELGTHIGATYCAFCQAVQELGLPTHCYALHATDADTTSLAHLRMYHDARYSAFSQVLADSPQDIASHPFASDGLIDLLRVSAPDREENSVAASDTAAQRFNEVWLPRMSARGVVLVGGAGSLWGELATRYPAYLLGAGVGVVAVGAQAPVQALAALAALLEASTTSAQAARVEGAREASTRYERRIVDALEAMTADRSSVASERVTLELQTQSAVEQATIRVTQLEAQLRETQQRLAWFESSRGGRLLKLTHAARAVLKDKGPLALTGRATAWMLGKRGYHLNDIAAPHPDDAPVSATDGTHKAVMFISGVPDSAMRYRCAHAAEALGFAGYTTDEGVFGQVDLDTVVSRYAAFVLHRVPYDANVERFINAARSLGKLVLFESDDWVFDPEAGPYIATRIDMDMIRRRQQTLQACDGAIVSTQPLREHALRHNANVTVVPNAASLAMLRGADIALRRGAERRLKPDGVVTIAYFSGTPTHSRDFLEASEALLWALERYPHVAFKLIGALQLDERFERFGSRVVRLPLQRWEDLPRIYTTVDISIAPLEPNNPVTDSKSSIKYLEAALCEVPTIASPRADFRRVIIHGENGLLAETPEEWKAALAQLIEAPTLRQQMGRRAFTQTRAEETSLQRATAYQQALRALGAAHGNAAQPLTLNWVLHAPATEYEERYRAIFQLANALSERGHTIRIYVEPVARFAGLSAGEIRAAIAQRFGPLQAEVLAGHDHLAPADATIATFWTTTGVVARHTSSLYKFYLIQEFAPDRYDPADQKYIEAERSYVLPLQHVCLDGPLSQRVTALTGRTPIVVEGVNDATDAASAWEPMTQRFEELLLEHCWLRGAPCG